MKSILTVFLLILLPFIGFSGNVTVKGKVVSIAYPKGINGAKVYVKNTNTHTLTNEKGEFSITAADTNQLLVFSVEEYQQREMKIGNKYELTVVLKKIPTEHEQIVFSGHQSHDHIFFTGSVSKIESKNYEETRQIKIPLHRLSETVFMDDSTVFKDGNKSYIFENPFLEPVFYPASTFPLEIEDASFNSIRRSFRHGSKPNIENIRIEEMLNYFIYDYPKPIDDEPFELYRELADCPWNTGHQLLLVGAHAKEINHSNRPKANITFLIDASSSMGSFNKLPLFRSAFKFMVSHLNENDLVSVIVYGAANGLVLPPTAGNKKEKILESLDDLEEGGDTKHGQGMDLALRVAKKNKAAGTLNKVIVVTDHDYKSFIDNTSTAQLLLESISKYSSSGIQVSNLIMSSEKEKIPQLEVLADSGNGNSYYISTLKEARSALMQEIGTSMSVIAQDVRIQVDFNPDFVQAYRLIGFENRFSHKTKFTMENIIEDEVEEGHFSTAVYEIIPRTVETNYIEEKHHKAPQFQDVTLYEFDKKDLAAIRLSYVKPGTTKLSEYVLPVDYKATKFEKSSENMRFVGSVIEFGLILKGSRYFENASFDHILSTAKKAMGDDKEGYRKEFIELVGIASKIK